MFCSVPKYLCGPICVWLIGCHSPQVDDTSFSLKMNSDGKSCIAEGELSAEVRSQFNSVGFKFVPHSAEAKDVWQVQERWLIAGAMDPGQTSVNASLKISAVSIGDHELDAHAHYKSSDISMCKATVRAVNAELASKAKALYQLFPKGADGWVTQLTASDVFAKEVALHLLIEQGDRRAAPSLRKMLDSNDEDIVRRGLGGLISLKEQDSVSAMIDASRKKSLSLRREIIFAVASIGGQEARTYLESVAEAEDNELLKAAAQQALEDGAWKNKLVPPH